MKRDTVQRRTILSAVRALNTHPTAEEIYAEARLRHPTVSRATVYRQLRELAAGGEIALLEIPGECAHFDRRIDRHSHVCCIRCGRVFDAEADAAELHLTLPEGFRLISAELVIKGICSECQQKREQ